MYEPLKLIIIGCGNRRRLLLGIGREDVPFEGLTPYLGGIKLLGASSDHLIADVEDCGKIFRPGDILEFRLDYGALLAGMTSSYVGKKYFNDNFRQVFSGFAIIQAPLVSDPVFAAAAEAPFAIIGKNCLINAVHHDAIPPGLAPLEAIGRIAVSASALIKNGIRPLILGGDRTTACGLAHAIAENLPGCGWIVFSAYADFNTSETGGKTTGGKTLATICGRERFPGLATEVIPERNIVLIGLRNTDSDERTILRDSGILVFTMEDIDRFGMSEIISRTLKHLSALPYLAVDLSMTVLDPMFVPGIAMPSPNGLSLRETFCAMDYLADSEKPVAAVVTEAVSEQETAANSAGIMAALFGKRIL